MIHPTAIVETKEIGEETRIWAFVHILPHARIGYGCNICDHCFIENDVIIGNNVTVKSGIYIWDGVRIADYVFLGPNVVFTNDIRPRSKQYPDKFARTTVGYGASIGANATVIAGNHIGKWAMIGAGTVITKDVPDYGLVYGNPGRLIGYVCSCGQKLDFSDSRANCACGKEFMITDSVVTEA